GEVAALDVFFGRLAEADLVGVAAVGVSDIGAEGGNFDGVGFGAGGRKHKVSRLRGNFAWRSFCFARDDRITLLESAGRLLGMTSLRWGDALRFRQRHEHYAKLGAYRVGLREDAHDFLGGGVGCDVVIGGLAS